MAEDSLGKQERRREVLRDLERLPEYLKAAVALDGKIKQLVQDMDYLDAKNMLLIGRGYTFANCLEGALKIKELTYMHAEGILAGELKHGPLALVDATIPIIMVSYTLCPVSFGSDTNPMIALHTLTLHSHKHKHSFCTVDEQ